MLRSRRDELRNDPGAILERCSKVKNDCSKSKLRGRKFIKIGRKVECWKERCSSGFFCPGFLLGSLSVRITAEHGAQGSKYGTPISIYLALERVREATIRARISRQILLRVKLAKVGSSLCSTARRT